MCILPLHLLFSKSAHVGTTKKIKVGLLALTSQFFLKVLSGMTVFCAIKTFERSLFLFPVSKLLS